MVNHDQIDSLIYLDQMGLLDYLSEQMGERFGYEDENEDVEHLNSVIDTMKSLIRKEVNAHYDGRKMYSTGIPFERREKYPSTEPGPDGGPDVKVIAECTVVMHPNGSPKDPIHPGGMFVA